ncbi:MAG TPA: type II 3-dehydroquinate dehydratase [Acholeplasmataceae bacterium]|nr:type II 3-dehydroquinate dehydratase [Acholeplasmataceae bacterium]
MNILIINGPNLNMLGIREKSIYGTKTYKDLIKFIKNVARENDVKVKVLQSNYEGKIIDAIHKAYRKYDSIIINPGALTHYSYAIYDALKAVNIKTVEVHLTNIYNRENFRSISVIKDACSASFVGKGFDSYREAIEYLKGV